MAERRQTGKPATETPEEVDNFFGSGASPSEADQATQETVPPVVQESPKGPKVVHFRSRRAEFGACVVSRQVMRDGMGRVTAEVPAKNAQFRDHRLDTTDPQVIAWLDKYIAEHADGEVFRVKEIDPLLIAGDLGEQLDSMQEEALRAACHERQLSVTNLDTPEALRYKLLKHVSGLGKNKTTKN